MKKIAIVISKLELGGIPTALIALLNELNQDENLQVDLFLFSTTNMSRFEIPNRINVIYPSKVLNCWYTPKEHYPMKFRGIWYILHFLGLKINMGIIEKMSFYKKSYEGYDVAIAYENDIHVPKINFMVNNFVLNCISADKKVSWIHNDPIKLGYTTEYLRERYKEFDEVVNVSKGCKKKFDEIIPEYEYKSKLVYNCLNIKEQPQEVKKNHADGKVHFVTVTRLSNVQKRIDRIVECCKLLKEAGFGERFVWHLFGGGPDEKMLRDLAESAAVGDVLHFEGPTQSPLLEMKKNDLFVMTSDYEAYGLTIVESLSVKTPVLVTAFEEAYETVQDGKNGFIVGFEPVDITQKLKEILQEPKVLDELKDYIENNPVTNERAKKQFYDLINCE